MSRTSRMLLVLAIFAIAGIAVLGMMARRYGSILERRDDSRQWVERRVAAPRTVSERRKDPAPVPEEAQRWVDAFIQARGARGLAGEITDETLAAAGLDRSAYLKVDMIFRAWKADEASVDEPFRTAFGLRREKLEALDP